MIINCDGTSILEEKFVYSDKFQSVICIAKHSESATALKKLNINVLLSSNSMHDSGTRFENHTDIDYIMINIPELAGDDIKQHKVEIFLTQNALLLLCDDEKIRANVNESVKNQLRIEPPEKVLRDFITEILSEDSKQNLLIEEHLEKLEDDVTEDVQRDYVETFSSIRKKLIFLKRYYESLVSLLEDLEENVNDLICKDQLRFFGFLTNRAERIYQNIISLNDYLSQIRDSYQAQVDIQLNKTMRLFTVVTTIFLPLTLVAGWYGMNLKMPEYQFEFAYPVLIFISIVIIIISVLIFKKKKWF